MHISIPIAVPNPIPLFLRTCSTGGGACSTISQVLGGADLFLQGLIGQDGGLGDVSAGDLRAVAIPGNPYPFAVGTMEVGSEDVARTGLKGKGLKLLHHFPDQLGGLGDKSTPDPSFTPTRIFPQQVSEYPYSGSPACSHDMRS